MGLTERETASVVPATSVFAQRAQVQSLYCPLRLSMYSRSVKAPSTWNRSSANLRAASYAANLSMTVVDGAVSAFKVRRMWSSAERFWIDGYDAVGRYSYFQVAHIGVGGSEEHTVVVCDTGQDDPLYFEIAEQQPQGRFKKS